MDKIIIIITDVLLMYNGKPLIKVKKVEPRDNNRIKFDFVETHFFNNAIMQEMPIMPYENNIAIKSL